MTVDWANWQPKERANLCFMVRDSRVLLIRKKRGLGAGKINGPGGKLDPGETALASAIRETVEEVGVCPCDPQQRGELHFQFRDGYSLHCAVFLAHDFEGEPHETDEATPLWFALADIPYDEMWEDDRHWLPAILRGDMVRGFFVFDGEHLLSRRVEIARE